MAIYCLCGNHRDDVEAVAPHRALLSGIQAPVDDCGWPQWYHRAPRTGLPGDEWLCIGHRRGSDQFDAGDSADLPTFPSIWNTLLYPVDKAVMDGPYLRTSEENCARLLNPSAPS